MATPRWILSCEEGTQVHYPHIQHRKKKKKNNDGFAVKMKMTFGNIRISLISLNLKIYY